MHNIVSTQFGAFIVKTDSTTVFFKTYSYYNSKFGFAIKPLSNVNCLKNQFKVGEQEYIISTFSADFVLDIRRSIIMFVLEHGLIKRVLQMLCGEAVESCKQLLNELHDFDSDKRINLLQIIQEFSEPYLLAILSGDKVDDVAVADYCKMLSALVELEHSAFKAVISSSDTVSTLITFAQHSSNPAPIFNLIYKIIKFKGDALISYQSHWTNTVLWAIGKKAILTNTWKAFVEMLDVLTNDCSTHFRSTVSSYCIQILCSQETFDQSLMTKLLLKLLEASGEYDNLESVASIMSQKLNVGKLDLLFSFAQRQKLNSATLINLKSNLSNPMFSPSILRILKLLDPILLLDIVPKILELTVRDDTRDLAIELLASVKVKFGNQFNQELKVYGNEVSGTVSLIGQKALVSWSVNKILEL